MPKGEGTMAYQPGAVPRFDLNANIDSLGYGRFGYGAAAAHARGTRDSLTWFARSRVGDLGAFLAGGPPPPPGRRGGDPPGGGSPPPLLPRGGWVLPRPRAAALRGCLP